MKVDYFMGNFFYIIEFWNVREDWPKCPGWNPCFN